MSSTTYLCAAKAMIPHNQSPNCMVIDVTRFEIRIPSLLFQEEYNELEVIQSSTNPKEPEQNKTILV